MKNPKRELAHFYFQVPDQTIQTHRQINQEDRSFHKHDFIELVIVLSGKGIHNTKDNQYTVQNGDVFVILPGFEHSLEQTVNLHLVNILIRYEYIQHLRREFMGSAGFFALFQFEPSIGIRSSFHNRLRIDSNQLNIIIPWINLLEKICTVVTPTNFNKAKGLLQLIIATLCEHYETSPTSTNQGLLEIADLISFMDQNLNTTIRLSDLAKKVSMSERTFSRTFLKITGHSPIDYLLKMRLHRAAFLLVNSAKSCLEIAYEVGFLDGNYFTRLFTKTNGISPQKYRKNN